MREIKLPAYPLLTFDPMMSLWSASDRLYESNVKMWTSHDKPILGYVMVDGVPYRFMGEGRGDVIEQTKVEMGLTSTKYTFENQIRLEVTFTTPFILSDLKLASRPIGYITVSACSLDGKKHFVDVVFAFSEKIVYRANKRLTIGGSEQLAGGNIGFLARRKQNPLYDSGDVLDADWGTIAVAGQLKIAICSPRSLQKYLSGSPILTGKGFRKLIVAEKSATIDKKKELTYHFCFGWDDGYALDYYGEKTPGYWKKFYPDLRSAIRDALSSYDKTMEKCLAEDEKAENDVIPRYGLSYYTLLLASFRQVIAAHSLIEKDGAPIFVSKENSSNGCAATVDVTYPSAPLFLLHNPALLKGMLLPVYAFARMKPWTFDFAPHDAGRYPYVMGQVYALNGKYFMHSYKDKKKPVFCYNEADMYRYEYQMPVEESANMIILTAAYYNETGDKQFVLDNADLLQKWADYLVSQGIELENQLSTDDFSGRLPRNVNLAIKSAVGIALWAKLAEKLSLCDGKPYRAKAEEMASLLKEKADRGDHYALILDAKEGWSTKYNLVWDKIFCLGLFGDDFSKKEIDYYKTKLNVYGLPLDSRNTYSKSDWMIWAAVLDNTDETLRLFTETLTKMLAETTVRKPYPDLFETVAPALVKGSPMYARTVQGGMWLPLYAEKVAQSNKNYLL